jgi:hypothetical protein
MNDSYTTAAREASGEYEEKKSVFYGFIKPIEEEAEALEYIEEIRRRLPNMRHTCYAYVNKGGNVVRFSDDKEPQGTAGMPILEVIRREGLTGVVIVVARYFGAPAVLVALFPCGNGGFVYIRIGDHIRLKLVEVSADTVLSTEHLFLQKAFGFD